MPVYDYLCPACEHRQDNVLVKYDGEVRCDKCDEVSERLACAPTIFTEIVPMYPGAKMRKAGHVHKFPNRPATKIQSGYGGVVSNDNPRKR